MSGIDVEPRSAPIIDSMSAQIELEELHRFTTDEYRRLVEAGAFEDFPPVELIDGLLVRKDMRSREHEQVIEWLSRYLFGGVDDDRYAVRVAGSVTLAIEVCVSSLRRDLDVKAVIYAGALVAEYWVVDVAGGRVVVHLLPRVDGYEQLVEVRSGGQIAAPAGLPQLSVEKLLRAAGA